MKHWALLILALLLTHKQVEAGDGFIRTRVVHFLLNGSPYYANVLNAYFLMYVATDPSERTKISSAFKEATSHGLTVARTWAFSDGGYRALQSSPGSYNEQTFQVFVLIYQLLFLFSFSFLICSLCVLCFFFFLGYEGVGFCGV